MCEPAGAPVQGGDGGGPDGLLRNLTIQGARRLLEQGNLPLDDIAASIGYDDAAVFRHLFRRSTGLLPGQYRRMFAPIVTSAALANANL